jgi:hypothetical protein
MTEFASENIYNLITELQNKVEKSETMPQKNKSLASIFRKAVNKF